MPLNSTGTLLFLLNAMMFAARLRGMARESSSTVPLRLRRDQTGPPRLIVGAKGREALGDEDARTRPDIALAVQLRGRSCHSGAVDRAGAAHRGSLLADSTEMNLVGEYLGQLGASVASTQAVRDLATRMLSDHKALQNDVVALAKTMDVDLPTTMTQADLQTYKDLASLTGSDFDRAFLARLCPLPAGRVV